MDEIRPWLFIGDYRDTLDLASLASRSITAMLQLAERVPHAGIPSLYLPVEDFAPLRFDLLRQGVDFARQQKQEGKRILVACELGINRSSAYCTAALKEEEGLSLFDAFSVVRRAHPESMPHAPVWASLCKYYNESTPYFELMLAST
jgi:protein-tyrosine phosphatase